MTDKMKHTPGPWFVSAHDMAQPVECVYEIGIYAGSETADQDFSAPGVASVSAFGLHREVGADGETQYCGVTAPGEAELATARANARLIAAAPELLEALREVYDALGTSYPLHSCDMDRRGFILSKARAVIAKATGANNAP